MSEYAEQFGVVKAADPRERLTKRVKPKPVERPAKSSSVKLERILNLALKGKARVR
jgi:hypothetical protein